MFWSTKIRLKLGPRKTPMDPALRDLYQALVLENAQGDLRVLLPNHDPGLSQWTRFWTRHQQTVFFVLNIFKHPVLFQDDIATLTACSFFGQRVSRVFFRGRDEAGVKRGSLQHAIDLQSIFFWLAGSGGEQLGRTVF